MPRYVIQPTKDVTMEELERLCQAFGGTGIRVARASRQVFCDLSEQQASELARRYGLQVKKVKGVRHQQVAVLQAGLSLGDVLRYAGVDRFREAFGLTGRGTTVVVLDSGVRDTHKELRGQVVLQENFTASPTHEDQFGHGTSVAHAVLGVAPEANIISLKVLGDDGAGTVEDGVMALERVVELKEQAVVKGMPDTHPLYPDLVNISWGVDDDGDPDDPLSRAIRAVSEAGVGIVAAAGNEGPATGTILCPACEPEVVAVGALNLNPYGVWTYSSRGPTRLGLTKPDVVFFGVGLELADYTADDAYAVKSGTSFSAPQVAGMIALGKELGFRLNPLNALQSGFGLVGMGLVKPVGMPATKDNEWGWGQPSGELMLRRLQEDGAVPTGLVTTPLLLAFLFRVVATFF